MSDPKASVVVATRDRPEFLRALLRSLAEQDAGARPFEVIVVDDASEQSPSPSDGGELGDGIELKRLSHSSPRGPAAGRNTGWRAGAAPLVAFIDDDCEATAGWLSALLATWEEDPSHIVQGRTEPRPGEPPALDPLSRTQVVRGPGYFETCNIAYPRALLEQVDGFDERFRRACGEDVDLGARTTKAGARLSFASAALVHHVVHRPGLLAAFRQTWRWRDAVRVVRLHPELRDRLFWRFFWKRTHPPLLAALTGLAWGYRRRRRAFGLAAALPYLNHYRRHYRSADRPRATLARWLPAHVAIDLCELVTMVVASLRHRTLML